MTILVVGASGATGRLLVQHLLNRGQDVKIILRFPEKMPETLKHHDHLSVIQASISDLSDAEMIQHVKGCTAVASCLGHNLSLKGIYGRPRRLVTDATRRLCAAIKANKPEKPTRFVLMNTAGNSNRDLNEPISLIEKNVTGLIRILLPPYADNDSAADYLRIHFGQDEEMIEWVAVRPDTLTDEEKVTEYEVHSSPIRSAVFNLAHISHF
ncbi:MAG TPA: NAD(P)H-binding protein [Bacteroidaceae bacterium]|nr:NAD(P)H-binding protein [Bacteroidaceae bacterium]